MHFVAQVETKEYERETIEEDIMQTRLPPLPFNFKELDERLFSAIGDLDNIIQIDEWEQEYYKHYERVFSKERQNIKTKGRQRSKSMF